MKKLFARNMGNPERIIRITLGAIVVLMTLFNLLQMAVWVAVLLVGVGVILIIEGILAWCPVRAYLGLGTEYHRRES